MISMQKKMFDRINEMAEARGLQVVQSSDYQNTGTLYIQRPDRFETLIQVGYYFQPGVMELTLKHRDSFVIANRYRNHPDKTFNKWYMPHAETALIEEFIAALHIALCKEGGPPKKPKRVPVDARQARIQ